jgi:nitrogen regulatory protein P-II 1
MKNIVAIIQPERLQEVKEALFQAEITKMTIVRVKGCGQQMGYESSYRGQVRKVNLLDKIRIGLVVRDELVEITIKAIIKGAKTGTIGDGKIFVMDMDDCIRIRTGERGDDAIG